MSHRGNEESLMKIRYLEVYSSNIDVPVLLFYYNKIITLMIKLKDHVI